MTVKGLEICFLFLIWAIFKNDRETRKHRREDIYRTKALAGGQTRCGADVKEPVVDTSKDTVHCDKRESGVLSSGNFQHKLLN